MTLYFIGMGPSTEYISLKAMKILRTVDKVYIDTYTSILPDFSIDFIMKYTKRDAEIVVANRSVLEGEGIDFIVKEASEKNIAIIVPGDPFIATTHDAIRIEALARGIDVQVVHGVSIYSLAPSATGLQAYRFGKTVTLVYPRVFKPYSVIETIYNNMDLRLHTLVLLDLKLEKGIAMTIKEAVEILLDLEIEYSGSNRLRNVVAVGLAQVGTENEYVRADLLPNLGNYDYPPPPHSIIIVADPHPMELEALHLICNLPQHIYEEFNRISKHGSNVFL